MTTQFDDIIVNRSYTDDTNVTINIVDYMISNEDATKNFDPWFMLSNGANSETDNKNGIGAVCTGSQIIFYTINIPIVQTVVWQYQVLQIVSGAYVWSDIKSITLNYINTPPTAAAKTIDLVVDKSTTSGTVSLGNATDADGDSLTYSITSGATGTQGDFTISANNATFTSKTRFNLPGVGTDTANYQVSDGVSTASSTITANIQLIVEPIEINLYPNQSRYHIDLSLYCQSLSVPNSTLLSYNLIGAPPNFGIYGVEYPYILIYVPSDSTTLQTITFTYSVYDGTYTGTNDITLHCGSTGFLENGHDLAVMYERI